MQTHPPAGVWVRTPGAPLAQVQLPNAGLEQSKGPHAGLAANAGVLMLVRIGVVHAIAAPAPMRLSILRRETRSFGSLGSMALHPFHAHRAAVSNTGE
jgi:hypothetical protein